MGNQISRCPKRIVEGGIVGTLDMGDCLFHCAAFQDWCFMKIKTGEIPIATGRCKEYGNTPVVARCDDP